MKAVSLLLVVALLSCGDSSPAPKPVCTAGQQVNCPCVGGEQGAQSCRPDGSGYDACVCPVGTDAGAPMDVGADLAMAIDLPVDVRAADAAPDLVPADVASDLPSDVAHDMGPVIGHTPEGNDARAVAMGPNGGSVFAGFSEPCTTDADCESIPVDACDASSTPVASVVYHRVSGFCDLSPSGDFLCRYAFVRLPCPANMCAQEPTTVACVCFTDGDCPAELHCTMNECS